MKVSLSLPEWLVVRLRERALEEHRSLSNLIAVLLEQALLASR